MHNLHQIIYKGRLDYLESNIADLKPIVNRAIFTGENSEHKKHPLQFVCDCVHAGRMTESIGMGFASLLVENGAKVNGFSTWNEDSPLFAAIAYYLEEIAHFLIDKGADYTHIGFHGATVLHWAAWTGQYSILNALLEFPVDIDVPDTDFKATPLLYGIHGYFRGGERNQNDQLLCIQKLLAVGANPKHIDKDGNNAWGYLKGRDGAAIENILNR